MLPNEKRFGQAILILLLLVVAGLGGYQPPSRASEKIAVAVSIPPLAEFIDSLAKEKVSVSVMLPPGASPHSYMLTPRQLVQVSQARMFVKVGSGLGFESVWMDKIIAANRDMLVVDSSKGIELIDMDPHIWLSPLNAKIMVQNIYDGLVSLAPNNETYYKQNRDSYFHNLDTLDQDIRGNFSGIENRAFIVFHPAWGYFARDYNLEQIPIEIGSKEPSAQDIVRLIHQAKERNIKVIFASPEFNPKSAQIIAKEIGGWVVFIDPLARDYMTNLRQVSAELVQAMR